MAKTILTIDTAEKLDELGFERSLSEGAYIKFYKSSDGKSIASTIFMKKNNVLMDLLDNETTFDKITCNFELLNPTIPAKEVSKVFAEFQHDMEALNKTAMEVE